MYVSVSSKSKSAAKRFNSAILIGSSTSSRRQASSHGCGQTRPIDAGSGILSLISRKAALCSPFAISPTYPWQSVCPGQAIKHGGRQSPLWSDISSSSATLRDALTLSLDVLIIIPLEMDVEQARSSFGTFSTSTTQTPHEPYTFTRSSLHSVGMFIPFSVATSSIDCPANPVTSRPSILSLIFSANMDSTPLIFCNGLKLTSFYTFSAFNTSVLVDRVRLFKLARDCVHRATSCAKRTTRTFLLGNFVRY